MLAAQWIGEWLDLLRDFVVAFPLLVAGGFDAQSHLLGELSGNEAPDAVVLPARRLGDVAGGGTALALQEAEDDVLLRKLARNGGCRALARDALGCLPAGIGRLGRP